MTFFLQLQGKVQSRDWIDRLHAASYKRSGKKDVMCLSMQLLTGSITIDSSVKQTKLRFCPAQHFVQQGSAGCGKKQPNALLLTLLQRRSG